MPLVPCPAIFFGKKRVRRFRRWTQIYSNKIGENLRNLRITPLSFVRSFARYKVLGKTRSLSVIHESKKSEITDHPVRTVEPLNALCFLTRLDCVQAVPALGTHPRLPFSVPSRLRASVYKKEDLRDSRRVVFSFGIFSL